MARSMLSYARPYIKNRSLPTLEFLLSNASGSIDSFLLYVISYLVDFQQQSGDAVQSVVVKYWNKCEPVCNIYKKVGGTFACQACCPCWNLNKE